MKIPKSITEKELRSLRGKYKVRKLKPEIGIFLLGIEWFGFPRKYLEVERRDEHSLNVLNPSCLGFDWMVCDNGFRWFVGEVNGKKIFIEHISAGSMASGRILRSLLGAAPKLSFALGLCGAVKEKPGTLILCKKAFGDWPAAKYWLGRRVPISIPKEINAMFHKSLKRGNVFSVSDPFFGREILRRYKTYEFVDMETYIYYCIAKALEIPYGTLFVVSDNIKEETVIDAKRLYKRGFLRKKLKEAFELLIKHIQ